MVELVAIKNGKKYIHFHQTGFTSCDMAKASVYPLSQKETLATLLEQYRKQGLQEAHMVKLIISEEHYQ